ncbi:MAG: PfkB family carbohydrate kinase [Cyclobacteriaceae bacterium]
MKKIITFGEIMLRLSAEGHQRFSDVRTFDVNFGGAEANVAVSLAQFGLSASFVSRLPDNELGMAALKRLRAEGVDTAHIIFGSERMGIYFLEPGEGQRNSNIIYDRHLSAMSEIRRGMVDWDKIFENVSWFHFSGITPAISQSAAETLKEAVDSARRNGLTVSCDLNYRSTLWKYGKHPSEVMPEIISECDVLIADPEAAEKMLGVPADTSGPEVTLRTIADSFGNLKTVSTTLRDLSHPEYLIFSGILFHNKILYKGQAHHISRITDRVGAGDAFTAGIIYGLQTFGHDMQRTLDFALASGCLKHFVPGDFNNVSVAEITNLMNGDQGRKIRR